jgi:AsmA protein
MRPRQIPWKWLLFGLAALLFAGLALLPRQFGDSSTLAKRVTDALSAWTGGQVKLTGPLHVSYFPDLALKSGFELTDAARLPMVKSITASDAKISLDLPELIFGRIRVEAMRLIRPEIVLKEAPSLVTGPDHTLEARVANLLGGAPIGFVRMRAGKLRIPTSTGTENVTKIDVRIDASSGDGTVSTSGSFQLRDETVRFALDCGVPAATADGPRIPVKLTLNTQPITAKVSGVASLTNGLEVDGNLQADMADLRRFLNWTGIPLPEGSSLGKLTVSGPAHWNGTTLTFDDGSFRLDGNTAVGLFAITPGGRPRIEGTVDFDQLVLDPYLGGTLSGDNVQAAPPLADQMILKHIDADLRVSANEIVASPVRLGRGAFTISAKGGVVAGELGELELCDGQATGRIALDATKDATKLSFTASLSDVPVEGCLKPFAPDMPLNGVSTIKAEATTEGRNYDEMAQRLGGTLKLAARAGAVPIDLSRLLSASAPLENDGWSQNTVTVFDQLNADCRLEGGQIRCETFNMQTRRGLISGSGSVDLAQKTLDWNLFVANDVQPLKASQLSAESPPRISIMGPLSQPRIRRADRATLGDGSGQATSPVSPR